jgi:Flp pilus assembly protein TadB
VAALAGLVAHGGLVGAIVEVLLFVTVSALLLAVWLRERRAGREQAHDGPARLRDDE